MRIVLLVGCVAVGLFASAFTNHASAAGVEPELVVLLRGMALIKSGIALAAIGLALWRFGRPPPSRVAIGYIVGVWSLVVGTVLVWCLSFLLAAAVIFHVGLIWLLVLAWREA